MPTELLIEDGIAEVRVALVRDGVLDDLWVERRSQPSLVGNIYLGRVRRVVPGLGMAFVDIGRGRDASLRSHDARFARDEETDRTRINELVADGEAVLVQVAAAARGDKGARLTTDIALAGHRLVYVPYSDEVRVSRRIGSAEEIKRLETAVLEACERFALAGGFVVRTAAEGATAAEIEREIEEITGRWRRIETGAERAAMPALIDGDGDTALAAIRDFYNRDIGAVRIDTRVAETRVRSYLALRDPGALERIVRHDGPAPLFDEAIEAAIATAIAPVAPIIGGGRLTIETTQALTAIDIDSGRGAGTDPSDNAWRANNAAVEEIARQLRLRNIAGTIVVDLVARRDPRRAEALVVALRQALARDRLATRIGPISPLGLLELTRRRIRPSLAEIMLAPAPAELNAAACAAAALRQVERAARREPGRPLAIRVAPDVASEINAANGGYVATLERRIGARVTVTSDNARRRDDATIDFG